MTDLIKRLRDEHVSASRTEAADRIEALVKERERLALAICGGEDAAGYATAQSVEVLEKVARDNAAMTMWQINQTLQANAKLTKAVEALRETDQAIMLHTDETSWRIWGEVAVSDIRKVLAELEGK